MDNMKSSIYSNVTDAIASVKGAYGKYIRLTLNERQGILEGVRKTPRPLANELAAMTAAETGMGIIQDEAQKIKLAIEKTPGVEGLITEVNTGDHGMTPYKLSSSSTVCAVQPCTNPCATLINSTVGMLAVGNAVIRCPYSRAVKVSQFLTMIISETIRSISGIDNLIVTLHESLMGFTIEVTDRPDADLVACTGGSGSPRQAMTSGKKVIGAEPASLVATVDIAASPERAVKDIIRGVSFDNNLMCTSEKCMVVEESISDRFIHELLKNGVYYTRNKAETQKLLNAVVTEDLVISRKLESRSAKETLEYAGIPASKAIKLIVTEIGRTHLFVITELMMPLVSLVETVDSNEALEITLKVEQGYEHMTAVHSGFIEHLSRVARELQTSVFVKNNPPLMGIGSDKEGHTSLATATITGEETTTVRHFARRRRCTLTSGLSIR